MSATPMLWTLSRPVRDGVSLPVAPGRIPGRLEPRDVARALGHGQHDIAAPVPVDVDDLHGGPLVPCSEPARRPPTRRPGGFPAGVHEPAAADGEVGVAVAVEVTGIQPVAPEPGIEPDVGPTNRRRSGRRRPPAIPSRRASLRRASRHGRDRRRRCRGCHRRRDRGASTPVRYRVFSYHVVPITTSTSPSRSMSPTALPDCEAPVGAIVVGAQPGFRYQTIGPFAPAHHEIGLAVAVQVGDVLHPRIGAAPTPPPRLAAVRCPRSRWRRRDWQTPTPAEARAGSAPPPPSGRRQPETIVYA